MFMNEEKVLNLVESVIATHTMPILKALGLEDTHDGIASRIVATPEIHKNAGARFYYQYVQRHTFGLAKGHEEYIEGSGTVYMHYNAVFYNGSKKQSWINCIPFFLVKKVLTRYFIACLAHELRHYWQYSTGEVYNHGFRINGNDLMPYQWRWEEKDANEFARNYLKQL